MLFQEKLEGLYMVYRTILELRYSSASCHSLPSFHEAPIVKLLRCFKIVKQFDH